MIRSKLTFLTISVLLISCKDVPINRQQAIEAYANNRMSFEKIKEILFQPSMDSFGICIEKGFCGKAAIKISKMVNTDTQTNVENFIDIPSDYLTKSQQMALLNCMESINSYQLCKTPLSGDLILSIRMGSNKFTSASEYIILGSTKEYHFFKDNSRYASIDSLAFWTSRPAN